MKAYTKMALAGQTLHLPVVGEKTLDKEGSLEINEKEANLLIDKTKGSVNGFYKTKEEANPVVKKQQITVNNETVKPKSARQRLGELLQEVGVTQIRQWIDEVFPPAPSEIVVEGKQAEDNIKTEPEEETPSNAEEIVNSEDIIEAINSCESKEELLGLIDLVPGVKKRGLKDKELEELKKFLVDHVTLASKKK